MINDVITDKVINILKKFKLTPNRHITTALHIARYNDKKELISEPNRALAHIGDRFLKLALAEEKFYGENVKEMNDFTNNKESNFNLYNLGIMKYLDGYCSIAVKNGPCYACENIRKDDGGRESQKMIATLVEAIIGAIYLDEFEKNGTSKNAHDFVKRYIIWGLKPS